MELQYLGTAAAEGWPGLFCQCTYCREAIRRSGKNIRRRSGALINSSVLIDLSADLYFSKLQLGLDLGNVRHIVITHGHSDHFYPANLEMCMDGFAYYDKPSQFTLYGSCHTASLYAQYLETAEAKELPRFLSFQTVLPYESFAVNQLTFTALPAVHSCPDSYIYLIEQDGKASLYGNDTGLWSEEVWQFLSNRHLSLVSLDATFGPIDNGSKGHMSFKQNIMIHDRMLSQGIADAHTKFICTHFSHNGHMLHEEMETMMAPKGFHIAYDGMAVSI